MLVAAVSHQERDTLMAANSTSTSAAKVDTVTLRHLAETLSEAHELPKKQVMSMLEDMVTTVTKHLKRGARIRIGGLGILHGAGSARAFRNGHAAIDFDGLADAGVKILAGFADLGADRLIENNGDNGVRGDDGWLRARSFSFPLRLTGRRARVRRGSGIGVGSGLLLVRVFLASGQWQEQAERR